MEEQDYRGDVVEFRKWAKSNLSVATNILLSKMDNKQLVDLLDTYGIDEDTEVDMVTPIATFRTFQKLDEDIQERSIYFYLDNVREAGVEDERQLLKIIASHPNYFFWNIDDIVDLENADEEDLEMFQALGLDTSQNPPMEALRQAIFDKVDELPDDFVSNLLNQFEAAEMNAIDLDRDFLVGMPDMIKSRIHQALAEAAIRNLRGS